MSRSPLNSGLTLAETIQEIGSERAVVGIDSANATSWPWSVPDLKDKRFSFNKLSEYLKQIKAIEKMYLFTSKYDFKANSAVVTRVIDVIEEKTPANLKRAEVEPGALDAIEYNGKFYDSDSILIIIEELIEAGKIADISASVVKKIARLKHHLGFNKDLSRRRKQGFEIVTADYRVYTKVVPEMSKIKTLAKYAVSVNGMKKQLVGEKQGTAKDSVGLRDNLILVEQKIRELIGIGSLDSDADLVELVQIMSSQAQKIHGELTKIIDIAESKAVEEVEKANADSFLVAEMMGRKDEMDTAVIFSGDGDFRLMYKKFLEEEKKVVIVSPVECLNSNLKKIVMEGKVSLVNPVEEKEFWEEPKGRYRKF